MDQEVIIKDDLAVSMIEHVYRDMVAHWRDPPRHIQPLVIGATPQCAWSDTEWINKQVGLNCGRQHKIVDSLSLGHCT